MQIAITFSFPIKGRIVRSDSGVLLYLGLKKWLLAWGGWGKNRWIRIFGLTILVSWWRLWPF